MELYSCIIEVNESTILEHLLIVAENKQSAQKQIYEEKLKYRDYPRIVYHNELKEVVIDYKNENILEVGRIDVYKIYGEED